MKVSLLNVTGKQHNGVNGPIISSTDEIKRYNNVKHILHDMEGRKIQSSTNEICEFCVKIWRHADDSPSGLK
jgi:hypothetical protein